MKKEPAHHHRIDVVPERVLKFIFYFHPVAHFQVRDSEVEGFYCPEITVVGNGAQINKVRGVWNVNNLPVRFNNLPGK